MKTKIITIITLIILFTVHSYTQDFEEVKIAIGSDVDLESYYGSAVSISGNYAIVSAAGEAEDASGENSMPYAGAAYIFKRDNNGNWNQVQKLVASDRAIFDGFSSSVNISDNYCIIGAPYEKEDPLGENSLNRAGSAYIFKRNVLGNWNEVQKIVASDRSEFDYFGLSSVAISGNYAIVGAPFEDHDASGLNYLSCAGSAYIFERDVYGNWIEVQKIVASDRNADDNFGNSVSVSGNYAIVAAYLEDDDVSGENEVSGAGSAYIFERDASGNWTEVQKITASNRDEDDRFGNPISISGDYAIVGACLEDEDDNEENTMNNAGSAYVFKRSGSGVWNEVQKIVASDRAESDCFGYSVSMSGDFAIVGAYMEDEDTEGENSLLDAGSAYIFKRESNGIWNEIQKIAASDRESNNWYGYSVAIDNNYAIVGTDYDGEIIPNRAYILESCTPSNATDPDNIIENGDFGSCILSPWSVLGNPGAGVGCEAVLINGKCKTLIFDPSTSPEHWHAQLNQDFTTTQLNKLEEGATYTLTFDAYAEAERTCRISFEKIGDPWTPLLDRVIEIGINKESYTFEFVAHTIFPSMHLSFQVGIHDAPVTFDNVCLIKTISTAISDQENRSLVRIFPNPTSEYINIQGENGSVIRLVNIVGKVLKTDMIENKQVIIPLGDLHKGIYIIEVSNEHNTSIHKVIVN
jgi:hypothetical protein